MLKSLVRFAFAFLALAYLSAGNISAQSSGILEGTVKDASGGAVPGATVEIHNPVSHYDRSTTTDTDGKFRFANVPFNPYHMVVTAAGFSSSAMDVEMRSAVPQTVAVTLKVASANTTVTVEAEAGDLVENSSTFHTDVDRGLFDKMPLESASSSATSLITLVSPGIAADSNGNMHALGDHAQTAFSIDGQMVTDQTSKVFSNQISADSIQSLEVISGAPPAEFGDKTSLVIKVTTRSGLGVTKPTGAFTGSFGIFGTSTAGFNMAYGGENWGNFVSLTGLKSGRFLDPPEFTVLHDKGNEENFFDRVDYNLTKADTLRMNFQYSRSWFQTPNTFDNLSAISGNPAGDTDQRSQIKSYNIAPSWTHTISPSAVFNFGGFARHDQYNYYPSGNVFADLGPINSETISQDRQLTNTGVHGDISWVKGIHNIKV